MARNAIDDSLREEILAFDPHYFDEPELTVGAELDARLSSLHNKMKRDLGRLRKVFRRIELLKNNVQKMLQ